MIRVISTSPGIYPHRVEMTGPTETTDVDFSWYARDRYKVRYVASVIDREEGFAHAVAVRVPPRRRGAVQVVRLQARHVEPGDAVRIAGTWVEVLDIETGTVPVGRFTGHPPVTLVYLDMDEVKTSVLSAVDMMAVQDVT